MRQSAIRLPARLAVALRRAARSRAGHAPSIVLTVAAALLLTGPVLTAGAASASGTNLVANPSFEANLSGWGPWRATISQVSGGHDGTAAAQVTRACSCNSFGINDNPDSVSRPQRDAIYTATAWVKAAGAGGKPVQLAIQEEGGGHAADQTNSTPVILSRDWQQVSVSHTVQRNNRSGLGLAVTQSNAAKGDAFLVDDLSLSFQGTADANPLRYPDLRTFPPKDLAFDQVLMGPGTQINDGQQHYVLRFTTNTWNAGDGPLEVRGVQTSDTTANAFQRLYRQGGGFVDLAVGQLVWHVTHTHWHFNNYAAYELWTQADWDAWQGTRTPGQERRKAVGSKASFCLGDNWHPAPELAGSPSQAVYANCAPSQGGSVGLQGMSVGWADGYLSSVDDQWVDLGQQPLADGAYVLRNVVDPTNRLYESPNKADPARESGQANEALTHFTVSGGSLTVQP